MGKGVIKIVLIAGAAYLVYRYASSAGWLGAATPAITGPPLTTATLPTVTATPAVTLSAIGKSLADAAVAAGFDPLANHNGYEWSWLWQRSSLYNGVVFGPTEMGLSDSDKVPIAQAVAVIARMLNTGLTGISNLGNLAALASAWN